MARRATRRKPPADPADPAAAMEVAARFLGTRPRSRWEVERRLRRAEFGEPTIAATLKRLTALGYLDDMAFARWWAEQRDRHAPRGRRMIEVELRQHGVPREVIEPFRDEHALPERAAEDAHLPSTEDDRARRSPGTSPARPPDADRAQGDSARRDVPRAAWVRSRHRQVCAAVGEQRARDRRILTAPNASPPHKIHLMPRSPATTPDEYVAGLSPDRREAVSEVRDVINRNLPDGYVEGMAYGMIGWYVPLDRFPDTYNGQPLGLVGPRQPEELHQRLPQQRLRRSRDRALVQGPIRGLGQDPEHGQELPSLQAHRRCRARRHR